MLREIRSMAGALAVEFKIPQRAADEIRMHIRRRNLTEVRGIYYPPDGTRVRSALILDVSVTGPERAALILSAVAHAYLRHRALPYYEYGADGPLYDAPRDRAEAELFARAFRARLRELAIAPATLRAIARR